MKKLSYALIAVIMFAVSVFSGCGQKSSTIVVGAKDFTEQDILGNLVSILFEKNTNLDIDYKHEMSSNVVFEALQSGDVDVYIDYTGTIYSNYLKYTEPKTSDEIYEISVKDLNEKLNLKVLEPIGFNNTYCLAIKPQIAEKYNIKTFSDLVRYAPEFIFGGTFEVLNRPDGIPGLKTAYGLKFKEELAIDGVLRYSAIENDETQVTEAFSTDGMLLEYNLVVLEDDKSFFPPYHAVPIIRNDTAEKHPELVDELNKLTNLIDDDTMRNLNYKVDVLKQNPKDVAEEFLKTSGLID